MPQSPLAGDQPVLVRKYGGSSLADVERIRTVARDLCSAREAGWRLVVVVSAMGKTTDELNDLARAIHGDPPRRELDMLLSVGERITMSLLSMALAAEGCPAISYTGSQCGIITDTSHADARILEVQADRVRASLGADRIVVVAGFQGVSLEKEITTLGRGGSDTTAVALAAALGAVRCEILKDVDGVLSADPRLVAAAHRHERLEYEDMLRIAAGGCGVVHERAVEYAARHAVPLFVGSSFHDGPGTLIGAAASQDDRPAPRTPAPEALAPIRPTRPWDEAAGAYRPLTMTRREPVAHLILRTTDGNRAAAWRALLRDALPAPRLVAEWLDASAPGSEATIFGWEVIADVDVLRELRARLRAAAEPQGDEEFYADGFACFSLVGCRPESWGAVNERVTRTLAPWPDLAWRLRADGSILRLLVPADVDPEIPRSLHAALF